MLTLIAWLRQVLPDFSTLKLLFFFLLSTLYSLKGSHYVQSTLKEQGVSSTSLWGEELHKLCRILDKFISSSFSYFIQNDLIIIVSVYTHGYLFCISVLFYFVCCSNCFSLGYLELFQLPSVFIWCAPNIVCGLALFCF